jgi:CheY-like chemotaxis protein
LNSNDRGPPSSRSNAVGRKKILIVDDSFTALTMMQLMLSQIPCDVVTAANGWDAVERALAERPDLILMDIEMPRMNGIEACRSMRRHDFTRTIPIILVTTRSDASHLRAGFDAGCTGYVTKPINPEELLTKVRNHLGR